VLLLRFLS
jgi:peptide/nickel transport system permease protein